MALESAGTSNDRVTVHPLRVEDVRRFSQWGHHTDLRFQGYDFPDLSTKKGSYALNQRVWFHKRSVPFLRWLYGIEDPSGNLAGYFKIVKKHVFQSKAELSMILDPDAMGKRYGTEAFIPLLRICFNDLGLEEVWVRVLEFNIRPLRLLEKTGFERYNSRLEPYSNQTHNSELLQNYPEDFSLEGEKLMTRYCYLKLSSERFQDLYGVAPASPENDGKTD